MHLLNLQHRQHIENHIEKRNMPLLMADPPDSMVSEQQHLSNNKINADFPQSAASATVGKSTAVSRVFATTELLENILEFLDIKDLLFAQRLNRRIKTVIKCSPKLRRALYLQADSSKRPLRLQTCRHGDCGSSFCLSGASQCSQCSECDVVPDAVMVDGAELNPLLFKSSNPECCIGIVFAESICSDMEPSPAYVGPCVLHELKGARFRHDQSLMQMLLTQPPITSITVSFVDNATSPCPTSDSTTITRTSGIRVQDLKSLLRKARSEKSGLSFCHLSLSGAMFFQLPEFSVCLKHRAEGKE